MTQKELAYMEDAIGHEQSIIKICNDALNNLKDESLISFMSNEISIHTETLNKLMNMLEVKANG